MNKKHKLKSVYLLQAFQVDHIFGIFETLDQAHIAACKASEPDSAVKEVKKYMPLHRYDGNEGSEFYLIWDETVGDWHKDEAALIITKMEVGKIHEYSPNTAEGALKRECSSTPKMIAN